MRTKFIESSDRVPLSELSAGSAFIHELTSGYTVFMVLNPLTLDFTGVIRMSEEQEELLADCIIYCALDEGSVTCIKKSDAKDEHVYLVQPVKGALEFRALEKMRAEI